MSKAYITILLCSLWSTHIHVKSLSFSEAHNTRLSGRFDYIVVGGGTAGCAIAASLSQRYRVLLLERGGNPYLNPNITRVENSGFNFLFPGGLESPNQAFTSEDGVPSIRPNVLGGGSSINGAVYNRADNEFLREAKLDMGLVNDSYSWVERVVVFAPINYSALQDAVYGALLEVGLGPDYGLTYEYVLGTKTTGITLDKQGRRHPASDLLLHYANPNNTVVLLHATVHKILFHGGRTSGVLYSDNLGHFHTAVLCFKPGSEVILSAGALGSPQLLMLSGIDPKAHLETIGIEMVLDSPHVGKGMADNPSSSIRLVSPVDVGSLIQRVIGTSPSGFSVGAYVVTQFSGSVFNEVDGPLSTGELLLSSLNVSELL